MSMLPPKKRDWQEGTPQIGVFLRTATGAVIEAVRREATDDDQTFALVLAVGTEKIPQSVRDSVREAWKDLTSKKKTG